MEKKDTKRKFIIGIGIVTMIVGLRLVSNNYLQGKVLEAYTKMNMEVLALNEKDFSIEKNEEEKEQKLEVEEVKEVLAEEKKKTTKKSANYVATLSIPKIKLNKGLVAKDSKYNSVDYGIQTLSISNYPNVKKGNLILLSHSGTSYISYFKNLYKLKVGDECYVTYKNKEYKYEIKRIYNAPKTGEVAIERDFSKTTLTLITCTKGSKTEQTIYIAELVK